MSAASAAPAALVPRADGEDEVVGPLSSRLSSVSLSQAQQQFSLHGHRPSVTGGGLSMDLSDESRDTVEVKDSDKWSAEEATADAATMSKASDTLEWTS